MPKCMVQCRVQKDVLQTQKQKFNRPTCAGSQIFVGIAPHLTTISKTPQTAIVSAFSCVLGLTIGATYTKETKNRTPMNWHKYFWPKWTGSALFLQTGRLTMFSNSTIKRRCFKRILSTAFFNNKWMTTTTILRVHKHTQGIAWPRNSLFEFRPMISKQNIHCLPFSSQCHCSNFTVFQLL